MRIFDKTLTAVRDLAQVSRIGIIMRHSTRYPNKNEKDLYTAGLTQEGVLQAEQFGQELGRLRQPGRLISSPVGRCLDTASAIMRGARWQTPVKRDNRLSHPFIEPVWNGPPICWGCDPLPPQVGSLVDLALEGEDHPGLVDLFTTQFTIVAVLAGYFTGKLFTTPGNWPDYLEGVIIWRVENRVHLQWREEEITIGAWPV